MVSDCALTESIPLVLDFLGLVGDLATTGFLVAKARADGFCLPGATFLAFTAFVVETAFALTGFAFAGAFLATGVCTLFASGALAAGFGFALVAAAFLVAASLALDLALVLLAGAAFFLAGALEDVFAIPNIPS